MAECKPVRLAYSTFEPTRLNINLNSCPVIFLHGVTSSKEYWKDIPQIIANATNRRAFALDSRNHGDSEWSDVFNFDINVDDLIHFMDSHGIRKPILIGQSMGGITAIRTALRWPDRIEKIVVEDMLVRKLNKQILDSVATYISIARSAIETVPADVDESEAIKSIFKFVLSRLPPEMLLSKRKEPVEQMDTRSIRLRRDSDGHYHFKANFEVIEKALKDPESLSSEPQGVCDRPALFIYGELSPFLVGADKEHIKQFFPNAVFESIEDASHDVHTEKPLEFTDAVLKFLAY